jgi:hypothetical protein
MSGSTSTAGDVHDPEDVEDQLRAHTTSAADLHDLSPFGGPPMRRNSGAS